MVSQAHEQLHILFFPLMAHGHMRPLIDIANHFASCGVRSSLVLTPLNGAFYRSAVENSGHTLELHLLPFPSSAAGLPEGIENLEALASEDDIEKFGVAVKMLREPFARLAHQRRPDCIVSDFFLPWTATVARELGVPRLTFSGSGYFSLCASQALFRFSPEKNAGSEMEAFVVPGLPDPIELTKAQLPTFVGTFRDTVAEAVDAESKSYGLLQNSFYEMEAAYVEHHRRETSVKSWHIGPVSLYKSKAADRGDDCLRWLDGKKPGSVLYVCFGSICRFSAAQLLEIADALESSRCGFIWVCKQSERLPEGFEERTKEKGLVVEGWAPQIAILNHAAVGGFLTHCGWNSILEAVAAGRPMATWPVFGEQFFNEKLVTEALRVGIRVGAEVWSQWPEGLPVIRRDAIGGAVRRLMGPGGEAEGMRRRAEELGEKARRAVAEGGSSFVSLSCLFDELNQISSAKKKGLDGC